MFRLLQNRDTGRRRGHHHARGRQQGRPARRGAAGVHGRRRRAFLMASNCEVHNRCSSSSIYNSLFVSIFPLSPTLLCATSTRALLYLFLLINAPNVCIEINALIITTGAPIHSAMTLVLYLPIKSHEKV